MSVVTQLKNRGVEQIDVACVDGLKGFPEAISNNLSKHHSAALHSTYVRNSVKYVSYRKTNRICHYVFGLCLFKCVNSKIGT